MNYFNIHRRIRLLIPFISFLPTNMKSRSVINRLFLSLILLLICAGYSHAAAPAGYSEYFIPGDEETVNSIFITLIGSTPTPNTMHSVITVAAWSDNTTVYYDHWEDGYDFDPENPATADQTVTLATAGSRYTFESSGIPIPRGTSTYYDGGDYVYVAGGAVTVTRVIWNDTTGVGVQTATWEIYPVKPQLTTYVLPFGENLGLRDFTRVFVLIQATADDTTLTVDLNGDGSPDILNLNRDATWNNPGDGTTVTLNKGQSFLLDSVSACSSHAACTTAAGNPLNAGTIIEGSETLQVKFIAGAIVAAPVETRGFSVFPRGFWTTDYYAPLGDPVSAENTDYYLYNPNNSPITINWESQATSSSFSIAAHATVSFRTASGTSVPVGSGLYFKGTDVFWGVGSNNSAAGTHEWGYSLLPSTMLYDEHFLGWAPGYDLPPTVRPPAEWDNVGIYITPAQDNTRVFVDYNNDGIPDQTYTLNRLQTQYVYDNTDGDLSGAHIWATGKFSMAYGENSDLAPMTTYGLDAGYVAIPGSDFVSLVLTVDKSVSPQVVPTASGSVATFTIMVNSQKYTIDGVNVTDYLPPNWDYVIGTDTTTITRPDMTTVTGAGADPTKSGAGPYTLSWSSAQLGTNGTPGMAENQEVTIIFTARTTAVFAVGTLSQNRVEAIGTRLTGTPEEQTFTTTDFAYVVSGEMTVTKTSDAIDPLYPGDQFTYTVTMTNPASATADLTGISIYDPLPAGVSYVADSGALTYDASQNVRDQFGAIAYTNNDGTANWAGDWTETDSYGTGPGGSGANANGGFVRVFGGVLQFRYLFSTVSDTFDTAGSFARNDGSNDWATNWDETNDDDNASGGDIRIGNSYIEFRETTDGGTIDTAESIMRSATVTGATALAVEYYWDDAGVDAGEGIIVEWSLNGATGWNLLRTLDGGTTPDGTYTDPVTWTPANTTIYLRFRAFGSYETNDRARINNVQISFDVPASAVGTDIKRSADLTDAVNPVLSFSYVPANLEAGDTLVVEASSSAAGPFTILGTYTGGTGFDTAPPYNLTSYISADTTIQFRITGGFNVNDESFSIDNVDITYTGIVTVPSGDPPNFLSSSAGLVIAPGNSLTLTYDVIVDNPLEAGINEITNTAYVNSNEIILPLSASVTNIVVNPSSGSASVGDRVWFDSNGDGDLDVGEPGLANVEVTLKDQFGTPLMTTTTDATGHYLFTGVVPGNGYYVEATSSTLPAGLEQSAPILHTDNRTDPFDLINLVDYGNNRDDFGVQAYNNSDGTVAWTNTWQENDTGGATSGNIQVVTAATPAELRITANASYIYRDLNIPAGATMATLSFDWRTTGVETNDAMDVMISKDGGAYTTLETFSNIAGAAGGHRDIDISSYLGTSTRIRFDVSAGYTATANDYFFVDFVNVAYSSVDSVLDSYLDADLGYGPPAGTATFGDLVWSDFDSDGVRDLGEPGLAGVSVELWQDNGDLLWDPGTDSLISSTVTAAGGTYLFTGVTPTGSEDYFIYVDPAQEELEDFTETTVNPLLVENVSAGDVIMTFDFGFVNETGKYTIKDRVWYDANGDEEDDGESGIGGVTVDLLNASLNVIASTITDASGYFSFNGVIGAGADYTVRITDTGSILSDYYGITDGAIAGEVAINNLNGNLDYTVEPTEPNFGYGLTRSISGTVFNDLDGDGSLDAGEPGMSGIDISLYNDVNSDGLLDGGDTLESSLVTDSNGNYIFSGLDNGNYIISIPSPPSGYDYTTETPDNDPAAGDQQTATIAGGGNVQNKNFGYEAQDPRSISGTLWEDNNADGVIDAGENGLEGVTIELLDGSTVVASTSTDSNGDYSFSGLTPITYTVRITDTLGVLSGYETTYEFDVGIAGPFDGEADADLSGGDETGADFGYREGPVITFVMISDFRASVVYGIVVISWDTAYENGTIGFYLYRMDNASGEYIQVNDRLIPGLIVAQRGGNYNVIDKNALPGRTYSYKLVEVEAKEKKDKRNIYGPFQVTAMEQWAQPSEDIPVYAQYSRKEHPVPVETKKRLAVRYESLKRMQAKESTSTQITALSKNSTVNSLQAKIKLSIKENGLYFLDISQMPFLKGSSSYSINRQVQLKNKGQQVAYFIADNNTGIYFYGEGIDSIYTDENIYWVERGKGTLMQTVNGKGPLPVAGNQTFIDSIHIEEDILPIIAVVTDPTSDFWTWGDDFIYAGEPGLDVQNFSFSTYGVTPVNDTVTLTVHLYGLTNTDHHAEIKLNGEYVGEGRWYGVHPESFTFSINQTLLIDADDTENTITVTGILDADVPYSFISVDSFDISYHRNYKAINDALFVTRGANKTITVDGFSDPKIFVLDVTDPPKPVLNTATTIDGQAGNYSVSFTPTSPDTLYLAISSDAAITDVNAWADTSSSLSSSKNKADYIVITLEELADAAQLLADYRQSQGLKTMVVKLKDIMDEFNYGIYSPEAIKDFLSYAYQNWKKAPRYVVLIGEGTYDYKDFSGAVGNLMPPIMVSTPDGIVATDTPLADINGDHLPEIAIGRLPVLTQEELESVINKIKTYEKAADKSWRNRIVMMADHPEENADFPLDSDSVAALLPQNYLVSKIYMSQQTLDSARTLLMNALQNGTGLINYIGHGGPDRLEQYGLLQSSDVDLMTNKDKLPLFTAITCSVGDFSQPGYDSLAELLFTKSDGGAIAVWSPAGYSDNAEGVVMDKEFFRSSYINNGNLLGDVVLETLENAKQNGVSDYMLDIYNIIGDPALRLK